MKKFWELLEQKGKIATIIGFLMVLPINIRFQYMFFTSKVFTDDFLVALAVINGVGMVWFMLPSTIKIVSKLLTIEVHD